MRRHISFLILIASALHFFSAPSAAAEHDCNAVVDARSPDVKVIERITPYMAMPRVTTAMLKRTMGVFTGMRDAVSPELVAPSQLRINLMYRNNPDRAAPFYGDGIGYRPHQKSALLPFYESESTEAGSFFPAQNRNAALAEQIHELGHAFFDVNFSVRSRLKNAQDAQDQTMLDLSAQMSALNARRLAFVKQHFSEEQRRQIGDLEYRSPIPAKMSQIEIQIQKARLTGRLTPEREARFNARYNRLAELWKRQHAKLRSAIVSASDESTYDALAKIWGELGRLQTEADKLEDRPPIFDDIETPYNEMFADAFAVVMLQDSMAISTALRTPGQRNFSLTVPLGQVSNIAAGQLKLQATTKDEFGQVFSTMTSYVKRGLDPRYAPHSVLDPSRAYFWKSYASRPDLKQRYGVLLSALLGAMISEIEERSEKPALRWLSPRELNRRLILKIDEEFKKIQQK